jgi:hypothetical protein
LSAGGQQGGGRPEWSQEPPSEEEIRARLEEELRKITVRDVLLQTAVTLVNLGGQRLGLTEQTRDVRDLGQARTAIEAVRALLPLLEQEGADAVRPIRDALAQLQMAYAREAGSAGEPAQAGEEETGAQRPTGGEQEGREPQSKPTGRLWVPPGSV